MSVLDRSPALPGGNGVGKSNLFDAIRFLSALVDKPLVEAAQLVRSQEDRRGGDIRGIFHRVGDKYASSMSFEADMIIPSIGVDDLNQRITASATTLRYTVSVGYREDHSELGELELLGESLAYIPNEEAQRNLGFPNAQEWRDSIFRGKERHTSFITTIVTLRNR